MLCVAAALWLHVNGFTAARPPEPAPAAQSAASLAEIEAAEAEAARLASEWVRLHPDGSEGASVASRSGAAEEQVAAYVSRSFRIPSERAGQLVAWAVEIGAGFDVDPLLILSVAAVESSFNPKARSGAGAEGLMQVMTRVHTDKFKAFGGASAALEAYPSLVVGTSILSSLIRRTGSVSKALKWYCGAANASTDGGYANRVMKERSRMLVAAGGDSAAAVKLSRAKRTGPEFSASASAGAVRQLGFSEWARFGRTVETRLSPEERTMQAAPRVEPLSAPAQAAAELKSTKPASVVKPAPSASAASGASASSAPTSVPVGSAGQAQDEKTGKAERTDSAQTASAAAETKPEPESEPRPELKPEPKLEAAEPAESPAAPRASSAAPANAAEAPAS